MSVQQQEPQTETERVCARTSWPADRAVGRRRFYTGLFCVPVVVALAGCGGAKPVTGGTTGTLRVGGELLSDIQVTVHQVAEHSVEPVGFGVTDLEGSFELVTNGARGALWLSPGEYRCTLESAGAPVQLPTEYAQAETTPLKVSWSDGDGSLDLEVPVLPSAR